MTSCSFKQCDIKYLHAILWTSDTIRWYAHLSLILTDLFHFSSHVVAKTTGQFHQQAVVVPNLVKKKFTIVESVSLGSEPGAATCLLTLHKLLNFRFLICKIGTISLLTSLDYFEN